MSSDCVIILDRPKTPDNVGTILRSTLALCGPGTTVIICGARFPISTHVDVFALRTDPSRASRCLDIKLDRSIEAAVHTCNVPWANTVVIERGGSDTRYLDKFNHPDRCAYIFGPEDGSVEYDIRYPRQTLEIRGGPNLIHPAQNCLNLATAVSIVLYDRLAKMAR